MSGQEGNSIDPTLDSNSGESAATPNAFEQVSVSPSGSPVGNGHLSPKLPAEETNLAALAELMQQLDRKFETRLLTDKHRETVIDKLHAELQAYKDGLVQQMLRPIVTDLVRLHDDLIKITENWESRETLDPKRVIDTLKGFPGDILDILNRQGVEAFAMEGGAPFDPRTQQVIERTDTTDPQADKTVAKTLRPGFSWDGRVFRRQMVNVYTFRPATSSTGEERTFPSPI